ncbi:hypothetical protein K3Z96_10080, partial [Pseudomonas aeruginosa]|nr:hypothetical protein [Pseudomonas aeruginosa]
ARARKAGQWRPRDAAPRDGSPRT